LTGVPSGAGFPPDELHRFARPHQRFNPDFYND